MYVLKVITLLMALFEMIYSARLFPVALRPGESRLVLSPNMLRKRQTKQELENELRDKPPFRKYNQETLKVLNIYEIKNDLRKSLKTKHEDADVKYVTYSHNDAFRKHNQETVKQSKNFDVYENYNSLRKSLKPILKPKHVDAEKYVTYLHDDDAFRKYNQDTVKQSKNFDVYENNNGLRKSLKSKREGAENDVTYLHDGVVYRKYNRKERKEPKRTPDDLTQYLYEKYNDFRKTIKSNTRREGNTEENPKYYDKTKESESLDKPLYRKFNRKTVNKPKKSSDDLVQYLYEKDHDLRKSFEPNTRQNAKVDSTNFYDNSNRRYNQESMQKSKQLAENIEQDRYENDFRKYLNTKYKNLEENLKIFNNAPYKTSLPVLIITLKRSLDSNKLQPERNQKKKFLKKRDNNENLIKKGLELGEGIDVKRRQYDSTSESSSKEFHSGEKRLFKRWRQNVVCGSAEMPKPDVIEDDFALRPLRYKSTNRLLNKLLWNKLWRTGDHPPSNDPLPQPQRGIPPLRRKAEKQFLVPPKTEFELRDMEE